MALPKLQDLQLWLSDAMLRVQGGGQTWRSRAATVGQRQEACAFSPFEALGGARAPACGREGPGGTFSVTASRCAQEAESFLELQGVAGARPARQAERTGAQTHHYARQATG
eukprot:4420923-Amphidinium_carterae.1